jgi:Raf kinase inhibitor-like YbhB/YbcL family protein
MKRRSLFSSLLGATIGLSACSGGTSLPGAGSVVAARSQAVTFTLSSTTFKNDKRVPLTMVYKGNGCKGGNQSPALTWTGAPKGTKSFAITMLDTTAIFWHWGMYGIGPSVKSLPENAGTPSSTYGKQVLNDWAIYYGKANRGYGGPCPPPGETHHYVVTLYALNATLTLPRSAHVENLDLAIHGHILGYTSITGLYRT